MREFSEQELERIERYVLGEMNQNELSAFKKELAKNDELLEKTRSIETLIYTVQDESIKEQINQFEPANRTVEKPKLQGKQYRLPTMLLAAASVVILLGLLFFLKPKNNSYHQLYANYYQADPGLPTVMGVTDGYAFYDGMVDYKIGDYQKAETKWLPLLKEDPNNDTLNYYLGMAKLNMNQYDQSAELLQTISKESDFFEDATWYRALIALKTENPELAKELLQNSSQERFKNLLLELEE